MAKVIVGMSGGVDSSVTAALLQQQGHEVIGVMLRLWSEPGKEDANRCCTPDSMALARRVAARLKIPFYVVDARQVFHATVVQSFLQGYAASQTPNPCLVCNRLIRWGFLLDHASALGGEYLATGHYARRQVTSQGRVELLRARDLSKDQSYVLHVLDQAKLSRSLFPLGEYTKKEVRKLAESFDLPVADRPDSQDLCFLAGGDYRDFIRRVSPETLIPGPIRTREGRELGQHSGLPNYTIGQRKGLGVPSAGLLYVLGKDPSTNSLIVGTREELGSQDLMVSAVNWISGEAPLHPFQAQVKTRYTAREVPGRVTPVEGGTTCQVHLDVAVRDVTPGQAAVFYQDDLLLGGGTIV